MILLRKYGLLFIKGAKVEGSSIELSLSQFTNELGADLDAWCRDSGFQDVRVGNVDSASRIKGVAHRTEFGDLCRAGLSRALIR